MYGKNFAYNIILGLGPGVWAGYFWNIAKLENGDIIGSTSYRKEEAKHGRNSFYTNN